MTKEHQKESFENEPEGKSSVPGSVGHIEIQRDLTSVFSNEMLRISQLQGEPRYKDELVKALKKIHEDGKFKVSPDSLYEDKVALEKTCGVNFDKELLYDKETFIAFWEGRYQRNSARFELMIQLVEDEKVNNKSGIKDNRSEWVSWYFRGCDSAGHEVHMPPEQNPDDVLNIFEEDCLYVQNLKFDTEKKDEAIRGLRISFLEGKYPIILGKSDPASRDAMRRRIAQIARQPKQEGIDLRASAIVIEMQGYRLHVSQGLDHETEQIKIRSEYRTSDAIIQKDLERRREDFHAELEFLADLDLPEYEAGHWPENLAHCASLPYFKIDRSLREIAHNDVRMLLQNLPKGREYYGDPYGVVICLLQSYWAGNYYPDAVRRMVMDNEIKSLPESVSKGATGKVMSPFLSRERFVRGSNSKGAKIIAKQDALLACRAYQRDMQLIRGLGLDERTEKQAIQDYHDWLMRGNLPIAVDCETEADRSAFEAEFKAYYGERIAKKEPIFSVGILQSFCDYWHPIAERKYN